MTELDTDTVRVAVDVLVAGWHPELRRALAASDPQSRSAISFQRHVPARALDQPNVTVLGDAIHVMPPIGGLGGNTAMRDAHLLGRLLARVAAGERDLVAAIDEYESDMREYGAAAVRYALTQTDQALATGRSRDRRGPHRVPAVRPVPGAAPARLRSELDRARRTARVGARRRCSPGYPDRIRRLIPRPRSPIGRGKPLKRVRVWVRAPPGAPSRTS